MGSQRVRHPAKSVRTTNILSRLFIGLSGTASWTSCLICARLQKKIFSMKSQVFQHKIGKHWHQKHADVTKILASAYYPHTTIHTTSSPHSCASLIHILGIPDYESGTVHYILKRNPYDASLYGLYLHPNRLSNASLHHETFYIAESLCLEHKYLANENCMPLKRQRIF